MAKKKNSWTVVIVDRKSQEFNAYPEVTDDTFITNKVSEAQEKLVDVQVFTSEAAYDQTVKEYTLMGYKLTSKRII